MGVEPKDAWPSVYPPRSKHARTDAALILAVINSTAEWQTTRQQDAVIKPIRELIFAVWEKPRLIEIATQLNRPLVRGDYPWWVPWSPVARAAYRADRSTPLVLEHVVPAREITRDLLNRPPANQAMLIRTLTLRLQYAVIAPEDNQRITAVGLGWKVVPGSRTRSIGTGQPGYDLRSSVRSTRSPRDRHIRHGPDG